MHLKRVVLVEYAMLGRRVEVDVVEFILPALKDQGGSGLEVGGQDLDGFTRVDERSWRLVRVEDRGDSSSLDPITCNISPSAKFELSPD